MYLKKTPNAQGRIRLSIVDNYYDKQKKCSRQKTIESIGFLDELEKIYEDPISHFQKRVELLNQQKKEKQAPINFTFYDSDRLCIGDNLRKNFGYAAFSKIYHELISCQKLLNAARTVEIRGICLRARTSAGIRCVGGKCRGYGDTVSEFFS